MVRGMNNPGSALNGPVDRVTLEVIGAALLTIAEEMGVALIKSSYSTNIKERRDCSVALFDGAGRLIAQGTQIPLHLGSLSGGVAAVLRAYPVGKMRDGDAFISNDPYLANGTHLPDITIVTPVFVAGRLEFFAANIGHHADVGGAVPGSIAGGSRSIFVLSNSGHIQSLINPPGNPRAWFMAGPAETATPETWLEGQGKTEGSWWPHWREWIRARSGALKPASGVLGSKKHPSLGAAPGTYVLER